jgi:4,5-DOPA dioxygenase extradiol
MYPQHDIPVVQISVQPALGPRHHVELGSSLRKLSQEDVLIIGSGHMTHNLRDWGRGTKEPQPYAREFQAWVKERLEKKDVDGLVDYRSRSAHGARAHPTDEHFLPLFFALGAAGEKAKPERVYDAVDSGVLAMDAYVFA